MNNKDKNKINSLTETLVWSILLIETKIKNKDDLLSGRGNLQMKLLKDENRQSTLKKVRLLEQADLNENYEEMDCIIEKFRYSIDPILNEFGNVYQIHRQLQKGEINRIEASRKFGKMDLKTPECKVFSRLMILPICLQTAEYRLMYEVGNEIDLDIIEEESYIKSSYRCRLLSMLANAELGIGDLKKAQLYAGLTINCAISDNFFASGYLIHGNTLLFSDYEAAKQSFMHGLNFTEEGKFHYKELRRSLSFLENYYGVENEFLDHDSEEVGEQQGVVFSLIKQGKKSEALRILESLENREQNKNILAFHFYYKGLCTDSKEYFFKSVRYFKESDDTFCIKLPLDELERLGENKALLELITV